jgi:hypothetical protein
MMWVCVQQIPHACAPPECSAHAEPSPICTTITPSFPGSTKWRSRLCALSQSSTANLMAGTPRTL